MNRQWMLLPVLVVALTGCGQGELDRGTLRRDTRVLASTAAEGALVARTAREDSALTSTIRTRTFELAEEAATTGSDIDHARHPRELAKDAARAQQIAASLESELLRLYRAPSSHRVAVSVQRELKRIARDARALEEAS